MAFSTDYPTTGTALAFSTANTRLASRGGRNPTSTGSGFGGSIRKGGLHQPPFYFVRTLPDLPIITGQVSPVTTVTLSIVPLGYQLQKMSRQWGHWRLGRGDGGHYSEDQSRSRLLLTSTGSFSATLRSTRTAHIVRTAKIIVCSPRVQSATAFNSSSIEPPGALGH